MRYRIKEVKKYDKSIFIPQKKVFWWWVGFTKLGSVDIVTGYSGNEEIIFDNDNDCQDFIYNTRHKKDIIYYYVY